MRELQQLIARWGTAEALSLEETLRLGNYVFLQLTFDEGRPDCMALGVTAGLARLAARQRKPEERSLRRVLQGLWQRQLERRSVATQPIADDRFAKLRDNWNRGLAPAEVESAELCNHLFLLFRDRLHVDVAAAVSACNRVAFLAAGPRPRTRGLAFERTVAMCLLFACAPSRVAPFRGLSPSFDGPVSIAAAHAYVLAARRDKDLKARAFGKVSIGLRGRSLDQLEAIWLKSCDDLLRELTWRAIDEQSFDVPVEAWLHRSFSNDLKDALRPERRAAEKTAAYAAQQASNLEACGQPSRAIFEVFVPAIDRLLERPEKLSRHEYPRKRLKTALAALGDFARGERDELGAQCWSLLARGNADVELPTPSLAGYVDSMNAAMGKAWTSAKPYTESFAKADIRRIRVLLAEDKDFRGLCAGIAGFLGVERGWAATGQFGLLLPQFSTQWAAMAASVALLLGGLFLPSVVDRGLVAQLPISAETRAARSLGPSESAAERDKVVDRIPGVSVPTATGTDQQAARQSAAGRGADNPALEPIERVQPFFADAGGLSSPDLAFDHLPDGRESGPRPSAAFVADHVRTTPSPEPALLPTGRQSQSPESRRSVQFPSSTRSAAAIGEEHRAADQGSSSARAGSDWGDDGQSDASPSRARNDAGAINLPGGPGRDGPSVDNFRRLAEQSDRKVEEPGSADKPGKPDQVDIELPGFGGQAGGGLFDMESPLTAPQGPTTTGGPREAWGEELSAELSRVRWLILGTGLRAAGNGRSAVVHSLIGSADRLDELSAEFEAIDGQVAGSGLTKAGLKQLERVEEDLLQLGCDLDVILGQVSGN